MKEKVLSGKKHGMLVMLITVALLIASVVGIVFGGMMLEEGKSPALFIVSLAYLCLFWILIPGFKILKPQEALVLTLFGILLGCFMGHWLHIYLVRSTEIDLMMFGRQTAPSAYVYAAILTMLFSVLVNVLAHFKMKKIDMVESLKSAE